MQILGRKYAFWRTDRADQSRNTIWARAEEAKEETKKLGRPLVPEILDQSDRVGAKSPVFDVFSLIAPQP